MRRNSDAVRTNEAVDIDVEMSAVTAMTEVIANEELYERFLAGSVLGARDFLWIGTADLKDLHVRRGRSFVPFLRVLSELVKKGVEVRLLHAKEPGPRFRAHFDDFPALFEGDRFDRRLCPRVHFKCIVIDGVQAYIGSANMTGAGAGVRSGDRRNFEAGVATRDPALIDPMMELFDRVFRGAACESCRMRDVCPDPIA